jgi:hypothetical protein
MVISNIKPKLYVLKLKARSAEKTWLLFVNVIKSFEKRYKYVSCHISRRDTEHSSQNRYCPAKIGTSGIPNHLQLNVNMSSIPFVTDMPESA